MSYKLFLILISLFTLFFPPQTLAQTLSIQQLQQQIEILRYEVFVLQSLLTNMRSQQGISANSYIAVNLADNKVLLQKNPDQPFPVASITKLMSVVIALEKIPPEREITLTPEMLKPLGQSPVLYPGLNISAQNLIKASLVQSVNDASESLSYFLGKSNFIALMNQKAKELGMTNSIFYDAHGLNPLNRSTASDLVKLLNYIYQNHPEILEITKDNDFWLPDASGHTFKFRNINNFYPLPYFLGGKTGFLLETKQTLAAVFEVKEKPVAIVVLYSNNRQSDIFAILRILSNTP